jgi:hypothetical protein
MIKLLSGLLSLAVVSGIALAAPPKKDEEPPEVRYAAMVEAEYGPLGKTTDAILSHEKDREAATVVGALVYRLRAKPLERLSMVEKKLLAVYGLKEEVDNGGFAQYFSGPLGDGSSSALQGLKEMNSAPLTKTLQKALAVFPASKPPVDQTKRVKLIDSIKRRANGVWSVCDEEFYLREDGLADVALAYAKKNRAQIKIP